MVSALPFPKLRSININLNIRPAAPPDAALIADFNQRLAAETEQLQLDPACITSGVSALLNDASKGIYFVAEVSGRVVGQVMITYEWSDWRNGMIWWLQSVYVEKQFRNQGVFRALFRHVENLARQRAGVCGLRLYMHKDNARARASYERLGMSHTHYEVFELSFGAKKNAPPEGA